MALAASVAGVSIKVVKGLREREDLRFRACRRCCVSAAGDAWLLGQWARLACAG